MKKKQDKLELRWRISQHEAVLVIGALIERQGSDDDVWTRLTTTLASSLREAIERRDAPKNKGAPS